MFLQETEVDFSSEVSFFSLNFSLFWQKVLKIGLFFLEKRKVDHFHQNFQCFQGILAKSLENLTFFWPIFQKISKESPIFLSKFSRFHALCSKFFRKLAFFPWKNGNGSWYFSKFLKRFRYRGKSVAPKRSKKGKFLGS